LRGRGIEHRPHRVHVVLVPAAGDVVDRDPLLVLDVTGLPARGIRRLLQVPPAVPPDPGLAHVVGVGHIDRPVGMHRRAAQKALNGSVVWYTRPFPLVLPVRTNSDVTPRGSGTEAT